MADGESSVRQKIEDISPEKLVQAALRAREKAYAPYSGFHVGAAVLADNGRIYTGCNVENASYGASICAERTAVVKAVSDGAKRILAVAVTGDSEGPTLPCGICRQVLSEFCDRDMPMYLGNRKGDYRLYTFAELMPEPFILEQISDSHTGKNNI
jgi:cytidine deaminase, homotetrameric